MRKMEEKLKHLEFIQNVITRMNTNSFLIKGWSITLISALFALAAKDTDMSYINITLLITPIFWLIDGLYLSQEKQYRALYDNVRVKNESDIDFSMDASKFKKCSNNWLRCLFTLSIWPFYAITLIIIYVIEYC